MYIKCILNLFFLFVIISDNEFRCLENVLEDGQCLEDVSLNETKPILEPDENIFEKAKSNLSDDDQSEQSTISESTTESYQGQSKDNVAKHQDNIESCESEKITKKLIVKELSEQKSAEKSSTKKQKHEARIDKKTLVERAVEIESPEKSQIKHESIFKNLLTKHVCEIESPKSEELVVKISLEQHKSDVESSTKKQKNESTAKETLEECKSNVESPEKQFAEFQTTERKSLKEPKDDVESPEKEEIPDEVFDRETEKEQKDNVLLPKPEEEIKCESIVEEELTKHGSKVKSPTKKQNKQNLENN